MSPLLRRLPLAGVLLLPLSALPLMGCGTGAPLPPPPPLSVPASLFVCQAEPVPPGAPDDAGLAAWIVDLADAGADCRGKLHNVKGVISP